MEDLAFVLAVAIDVAETDDAGAERDDAAEEGVKLSLFIAQPASSARGVGQAEAGGSGAGIPPGIVRSASGPTTYEALTAVQSQSSRWLHLSHNRVVIVSADVARRGRLRQALDFFDRSHLPRRTALLILVDGVPAEAVIRAAFPLEENAGEALSELLRINNQRLSLPLIQMNDFLVNASLRGIDPVATLFVGRPSGGGAGPEPMSGDTLPVHYAGLALFSGDRAVGTFDVMETLGWTLATGAGQGTQIAIPCIRGSEKHGIVFEIQRTNGAIDVTRDASPRGRVTIRAEGRLAAVQCEAPTVRDSVEVTHVNRMVEEAIKSAVERAIQKSKSLGTDPFGFGANLERAHPGLWKEVGPEWADRVWPAFPVDIHVRVDMRRPGLVSSPLEVHR